MDAKEALQKIKAAEQKSEHDMRQAKLQAEEILQAAQRKIDQLLNTARNSAKTDGEKFQAQSEAEAQDEISCLEKETVAGISKIRKKAAQTNDKALDFIISKLDH